MGDWSTLPYDILGAIVLKFNTLDDCIRFCAVCHSWKYAYTIVKEISQSRIMPWLLLAENNEENPECFRKLFCPSTNKCYLLKLPETFGRRCWGSRYGWLVTVGLDQELHLFNPLTKARLCLPHLSTFPNQPETESSKWLRKNFVQKAIVLRILDEFLVFCIYGEKNYLAFARPGDKAWSHIDGPSDYMARGAHDVSYWDGKIVVVYGDGAIRYCDINSSSPHMRDLLPSPPTNIQENRYKIEFTLNKLYLVKSHDELLIVMRYKTEIPEEGNPYHEDEDICYETIDLAVYKPNFDSNEWKEVYDVGDVALFIGDNHSMSVDVINSDNCARNRIYFTDDEYQYWSWPREFGGHDMDFYDIGDPDSDFIPYYKGGDFRSEFCTPLWFTPMI